MSSFGVLRIGVVCFLSFVVIQTTTARTHECHPSEANAGQEEFAKLANALQPGDELVVHAGTYSHDGRRAVTAKGTADHPIVIRAAEGESPLFTADPRNNCIEFVDCAHLVIRGLRFRGGSSGVRFIRGEHVTFEDCEILETQNNALTMNSGNCQAFVVRRNHIHHTGLNTLRPTEGEGMYIGCHDGSCRTTDSIFEGNYIHHTRGTSDGGNDGIEIKAGSYGNIVRNNVIHDTNIEKKYPGIFVYGGGPRTNVVEGNVIWHAGEGIQVVSDAVVRNNIIFDCEATGITAAPHAAMPQVRNVTIVNNTIFNAPVGVRMRWAKSTNSVFANNAIYCPSGSAVIADVGSALLRNNYVQGRVSGISIDDRQLFSGGEATVAFVGATKNDFWPRGSALIGKADSSLVPEVDFNGTKRTPPFDVGAYETDDHAQNIGWRIEPGFKETSSASTEWRTTDQPNLRQELENAPILKTESLGEPARGVNVWERWMVPNHDGKSWDLLQIYFKEYYGPTWLCAVDLGSGEVKLQRLADNHQFYLSGRALGFDGKYYIATPSRKTGSMDLFVYDPATNAMEERGEIVHGLSGEVRPLVVGPDGRIYGTGARGNQVGLYIYDPVAKKVVKDFGAVGPKHPNGAWSRYVMAVDDTHAYIASGMIPAWYLVAINLESGEEKILLESPSEKVMDILEDFPSGYARVPQESGPDKEFWLYHGEAIPKTNDRPPWPKKDSPWAKAVPRPEVYFDQIDPDENGHAVVWYRNRAGNNEGDDTAKKSDWKAIQVEGVKTYPHRLNPLSLLPDGRLYGTGDDYVGTFLFDPKTDTTTYCGPRVGLAPYTTVVQDGKLYLSGYSGGHLFVFDPARPFTLGKGGPSGDSAPSEYSARSNPRNLGDFDRTTRVGLMHSSAVGADGKIYFSGFGLRHYTGGGFGWFDPKTGKMDGIWQPLSGYAVQWIAPVSDAKFIVISTIRAPDELNNNKAPNDAKLFVFDVGSQKIVREIISAPKLRTTGLIKDAGPGRLLGLTISGAEYGKPGSGMLYGVDLNSGATLFTKALPWPVSIDDYWPHWVDPSYEYLDLVPGPDGMFWTYLKNILVRIDPKDATVHVVGKLDPVGFPTFVGRDVYFSGPEQLRRIRSIVPAQ